MRGSNIDLAGLFWIGLIAGCCLVSGVGMFAVLLWLLFH